MSTKSRMDRDVETAYQIQVNAGVQGMLRGTTIGLGLAVIAHYSWPLFRRQTLPFKAYLVSGCTIFGLVMSTFPIHPGAEHALLAFQNVKRKEENAVRREARMALAKQGLVGTETEIAKWRDAKEAREREEAQKEA